MTTATLYHASFYAEVYGEQGPTGEGVFCDGAILQDYGGNKVAGPFTNPANALAAARKYRGATRFVAVGPHRIVGQLPDVCADIPSVQCGGVLESEVETRRFA